MVLGLAALTLSGLAVPTFAESTNAGSEVFEDVVIVEDAEESLIQPRINYDIIDEDVRTSGHMWDQPSGYSAYRIYVTNNRTEKMTMTVKYSGKSYTYDVPAKSGGKAGWLKVVTNNAVSGRHEIDFTTPSGTVDGEVTVRVSDSSLS